MPINVPWIVAGVGVVLAILVWGKTRRAAPAFGVFLGAIIIIIMSDPSMLTTFADAGSDLLKTVVEKAVK